MDGIASIHGIACRCYRMIIRMIIRLFWPIKISVDHRRIIGFNPITYQEKPDLT